MHSRAHRYGFSLVELSIVLVVVSLIIGGILAGKTMVRSSQLNSILTEAAGYQNAVAQFQRMYNAMPGDMSTATNYWGTANGGCPNGAGDSTETCNGNGNAYVLGPDEMFRAWQHLANAELIEGHYTGTYTLSGGKGVGVIDVNTPGSRLESGGWTILARGSLSGVDVDGDGDNDNEISYTDGDATLRNWILYGGERSNNFAATPIITAKEALSLDSKVDDGRPAYGTIQAGASGTCTTSTTVSSSYATVSTTGDNH